MNYKFFTFFSSLIILLSSPLKKIQAEENIASNLIAVIGGVGAGAGVHFLLHTNKSPTYKPITFTYRKYDGTIGHYEQLTKLPVKKWQKIKNVALPILTGVITSLVIRTLLKSSLSNNNSMADLKNQLNSMANLLKEQKGELRELREEVKFLQTKQNNPSPSTLPVNTGLYPDLHRASTTPFSSFKSTSTVKYPDYNMPLN